jgi:hypothetical protein
MPLYTFSHPETGELKDIVFGMNEEKSYIDESGTKWNREYGSFQLNSTGSVDPWDSKSFIEKTNQAGTMGDLLDRSADLSRERASQNGGVDPVREKYYSKYSKERNGALHPDKMPKTFENKNIKIEI